MSADFGANDWLVEEMYERYQGDPNSVEPSWIEFFKTYKPGATNSAPVVSATNSAPVSKSGTPPIPKATQKASTPAPSTLSVPIVSTPAPVVSTPAPVV